MCSIVFCFRLNVPVYETIGSKLSIHVIIIKLLFGVVLNMFWSVRVSIPWYKSSKVRINTKKTTALKI